jgi:hypothetical protein
MPADRDVLNELHERLAGQLAALTSGEDWLAFLQASRRFHRYSPGNQMLLLLQGAEGHVASYRAWQRIPAAGGGTCQVRKGERGLVILAPMTIAGRDTDPDTDEETTRPFVRFKPVKVFHQGQLVAPPDLPTQPLPALLTGDNRHQHVWAAVAGRIEEAGYTVDKVTRPPFEEWNGRTNFTDRTVVVAEHLQPPAALKTLFHEWAHITLQHDSRLSGRRDLQEVEAESVAYLLCATIGVDSARYSVPYLASWASGDPQLLHDTAQAVLAATGDLVHQLEDELSIDLTPDLTAAAARGVEPATPADLRASTDPPSPTPAALLLPEESAPLDEAAGEVRVAMLALASDSDRARLLDAVRDLDHQLDVAIELFADAGFDTARTLHYLTQHGIPQPRAAAAVAHLDSARPPENSTALSHPQATGREKETAPLHERVAPPNGGAVLDAHDRQILDRLDLTDPHHLTQACRLLAAAGLAATDARAVLADYNVDAQRIERAITARHYNPASGRDEPLWPTGTSPPTRLERPAAAVPPHDAVQRAAANGEPLRLVHLNDAFGLDHANSIRVWADAGLTPDVVVAAAIAGHDNDVAAAIADLKRYWDRESVDWHHLTHPPAPTAASPAESILRAWEDQQAIAHGGPDRADLLPAEKR